MLAVMNVNGIGVFGAVFFGLLYFAVIIAVVWMVISALIRTARGVEDIAATLRRIEAKWQDPNRPGGVS